MRTFLMISVLFFLLMGSAWAQCTEACKSECCAKKAVEKKCGADCQKACCAKAVEKKCGADCQKACCAKAVEKKCGADCQKECCKASAKDEEMQKWMEYATPGKNHSHLEPLVGEWVGTSTWWMEPNQPPHTSVGSSKTKWLLGGRYLLQEYKCDFMGMPFEGVGITAYDNLKKHYEGMWLDTFGTGVYRSTGTYDEATKVLTSHGEMMDPHSGTAMKTRDVLTIIDQNKHTFQMYIVVAPDGTEMKVMEIVYTRK